MKHIERTDIYQSAEIAELFGIAERHIWQHLNAGTLPGRKMGRHWFCVGGDILDFVSCGNQAGNTHTGQTGQTEQSADNAHNLSSRTPGKAHLPGTVPASTPTAQAAGNAHTSDNAPTAQPAGNAHTSDIPTTERQRRVQAVKAAYAATDDYSRAADLLNQQIDEGGPRPERADTWSASVVRQMLARLK